MIATTVTFLSLLVLVPLASAWRLTPLTIDQHPCKSEKLKVPVLIQLSQSNIHLPDIIHVWHLPAGLCHFLIYNFRHRTVIFVTLMVTLSASQDGRTRITTRTPTFPAQSLFAIPSVWTVNANCPTFVSAKLDGKATDLQARKLSFKLYIWFW